MMLIFDAATAKRLQLAEGSDEGYEFLAIKHFLIKVCALF